MRTVRRVIAAMVADLRGVVSKARWSAAVGLVLPDNSMQRVRSILLRRCGWSIGSGTLFDAVPTLSGDGPVVDRLTIGSDVYVNVGGHWDVNAPITIGDRVSFGHQVMLVTTTHELATELRRAGDLEPRSIAIGDGAWLGSRVTVLPGVTVGDGAVIGAGSVVRSDVPPNTLFAGNPAKLIRELQP